MSSSIRGFPGTQVRAVCKACYFYIDALHHVRAAMCKACYYIHALRNVRVAMCKACYYIHALRNVRVAMCKACYYIHALRNVRAALVQVIILSINVTNHLLYSCLDAHYKRICGWTIMQTISIYKQICKFLPCKAVSFCLARL